MVLDLPLDKNCRLDGDILYIIETANSATVYKMEDGAQDEIGVSDCEGARASLNPYDPTNGTFSAGQTWVRATYNHGVSRWEMETF